MIPQIYTSLKKVARDISTTNTPFAGEKQKKADQFHQKVFVVIKKMIGIETFRKNCHCSSFFNTDPLDPNAGSLPTELQACSSVSRGPAFGSNEPQVQIPQQSQYLL